MSAQDTAQDTAGRPVTDGAGTELVPLEWAVTQAVMAAGILYSTRLWPRAGVERRGDTVVIDTGTGAWLNLVCGPAEVVVEAAYDDACGLRRVPHGRAASPEELTGIIAGWLYRMGVEA